MSTNWSKVIDEEEAQNRLNMCKILSKVCDQVCPGMTLLRGTSLAMDTLGKAMK